MQLLHVRVELRVRDHVDDAAVLHHVVPVGDRRREAEVLLDQQDREALRLQLARSCARSAGRSPAPGPRSARRAAAAARRCAGCGRSRASAARRPRAWCPGSCRRSFRFGKSSKICVDRQPALAHHRRQQQVLLDVEAREDAALLGAVGDAAAARSGSTASATDLAPSNAIEPSRRGTMPMIDFSVVVLPAPLRPSSVTTSPAATSKSTPCRTCDSPYQALSSRTASSGAPAAPAAPAARPRRARQASAVPR